MTATQTAYLSTFLSNLSVALLASGVLAILVLAVTGQFQDDNAKGKAAAFVAGIWCLATVVFVVGLTGA